MLLSQGSFLSEFSRFLLLIFWICLPILLLAAIGTAYFHYRHRRKRRKEIDEDVYQGEPVHLILSDGDRNDPIIPEILKLKDDKKLSQLRVRLSYSFARYTALAKDFEILLGKHQSIFSRVKMTSETSKNKTMEKIHLEVQQTLQEQIDQMQQHFEVEKSELRLQLEELNLQYEGMVNENKHLRDQLAANVPVNTDHHSTTGEQNEEEIKLLKNRVTELEYMEEIVNEKKAQIGFLQNQLDQRIRAQHMTEQQLKEVNMNLSNLSNDHNTIKGQFDEMKNELESKRHIAEELQNLIAGKDEEIQGLRESLQAGEERIKNLKENIHNLQHNNEGMNISIKEKEELLEASRNELNIAKEEISRMKNLLSDNKQILHNFYMELSAVIEEKPGSRVIAMKPLLEPVEKGEISETTGQHSDLR